jgi:signal transduction histidine kinase
VTAQLILTGTDVKMSISDNGKGFEMTEETKTLGLLGMKERAIMIGGELEIRSAPGQGTSIFVTVPVGPQ